MNTNSLFNTFGLSDQEFINWNYEFDKIYVKVKTKDGKLQCSNCKGWNVVKSGVVERLFRSVPFGKKPVYISGQIQRLECLDCGAVRQENIGYAESKKTYTHSFRRYVLELCRLGTVQDISNHLGVSWDIIKDIYKDYDNKQHQKPDLTNVDCIAIEEFSTKNNISKTVVVDINTGIILHVGQGSGSDSLDMFWRKVKRNRVQIKTAVIELSGTYYASVRKNSPNTQIVIDQSQIKKLFTEETQENMSLQHDLDQVSL